MFETPDERWTTTINGSTFLYYETVITCIDGHTMNAMIRAHCDLNDAEQPIGSVAFVTGTLFIDSNTQTAYLDNATVKHMYNWCFVPTNSVQAAVFKTSVRAVGLVCGDSYELDDESILFPVKVSLYILNDIKSFRVMYNVFPYFDFPS